MTTQIGSDIRALRKARGMTLMQASSRLSRSVGWLSQVERGHSTPSITDLEQISQCFSISINFFFRSEKRDPAEKGLILRADDRFPIGDKLDGVIEELLSPYLGGDFEIIRSTFRPGASSGGLKNARQGEDGGVLIAGELVLEVEDFSTVLRPGDVFQFRNKRYGWRNDGSEPAVVIWIGSSPRS